MLTHHNTKVIRDINEIKLTKTVLVCLSTIASGLVGINPHFTQKGQNILALLFAQLSLTPLLMHVAPVPTRCVFLSPDS